MSTLLQQIETHDAAARMAEGEALPTEPRLRVLHVVNGEHYAGAERVQDLLAERLPAFGIEPGIACLKPGRFAAARRCQSVPLTQLPMRGRFDLRPVAALARLVRAEGCDIVHAHTPRAALVARLAAAWTRRPLVYHVHSPVGLDSTRRWANRCNGWVERLSLLGAAAVITVSRSLAGYMFCRGVPRERIHVVPNGVPIVEPLPLRLPSAAPTVGMVALFRPRKGLETLLESLAALQKNGKAVRLWAIGRFETAEYEADIRRLAADLGLNESIEWRGFRSDVRGELAAVDLLVLPSLFGEGLPMVVLEAMAAGVPVVATRVQGVPEVIRDGVDGLLAEPGDTGSLTQAIGRLLGGDVDAASLRANALERQRASYSDVAMAQAVARVYRQVCAVSRT